MNEIVLLNISGQDRPASVQMTLRGAVNDLSTAHAAFLQLGQAMDVDIAIQHRWRSSPAASPTSRSTCNDALASTMFMPTSSNSITAD